MAKSVNKCIFIGNVGKDPEVKTSASGVVVAKFSLAVNDRFKDKDGEWQDKTEWVNLLAFKRTAEIAEQYVKKGDKIYIEGKLQTSSWEDRESGEKKYRTEVLVNDLVLLGGKKDSDSGEAPSGNRGKFDKAVERTEITDEDIPF